MLTLPPRLSPGDDALHDVPVGDQGCQILAPARRQGCQGDEAEEGELEGHLNALDVGEGMS